MLKGKKAFCYGEFCIHAAYSTDKDHSQDYDYQKHVFICVSGDQNTCEDILVPF